MALTSYSTIANFLVRDRVGLAFVPCILSKKHGLKLRTYTFATLLYYAVYACLERSVAAGVQRAQVLALAILGFWGNWRCVVGA